MVSLQEGYSINFGVEKIYPNEAQPSMRCSIDNGADWFSVALPQRYLHVRKTSGSSLLNVLLCHVMIVSINRMMIW